MSLYKNKYRNESARLPGYDYSTPGYYFVTVCTHDRWHLFGEIINGEMVLNGYGIIVQDEWDKSFAIRHELVRDEFVIMPNHFHGIVQIVGTHGQPTVGTHGQPTVGTHGQPTVGTHGRPTVGTHGQPTVGAHGQPTVGAHGRAPTVTT